MAKRVQILVRGVVQGVGFRPYVFSLARQSSLRGHVLNNGAGVLIDVEGDANALELFISEIKSSPPPLSRVESVELSDCPSTGSFHDFRIVESEAPGSQDVLISSDIATCPDCLREMWAPDSRRYRYPFINCTNCGPRFTIVEGVPYDRARTTMRDFPMCVECRAEYRDPLNRRFHAEPIACPICGPQVFLADANGARIAAGSFAGGDAIGRARELLLEGAIVAIKGLGGIHLACDALAADAVTRLRNRKHRDAKPFALMADSVDVVKAHCFVSPREEQSLLSRARPIVLLARRSDATVAGSVAPGVRTLGFVLSYTPLHSLLLEKTGRPFVMTSGNVSDEPICYEDDQVFRRLGRIADYFLLHDRRIHMRADDSVARVHRGCEVIVRRSRGFAPEPIRTAFQFDRQILACGAELKNTFCMARGRDAFISHHIGDLENLETLRSFEEGIDHFKSLFGLRPEVVAYDLHPEYLSTKYALERADAAIRVGVQHHHAHIASCLADCSVEGEVIGVAMDGLGFGEDGRFWGGEFFVADFVHAERIAHLDYIPMPGGSKAVREPWRMAAVYLRRALGNDFLNLDLPFVHSLDRRSWTVLERMMATGINSPESSSMGRLFDAIAAVMGLKQTIQYEGQAAIELEAIAAPGSGECYEFGISSEGIIRAEPVIERVVDDLLNGVPRSHVSARFHRGVAHLILEMARNLRYERNLHRVALSGGVFQNILLVEQTRRLLEEDGFNVLTHSRVPANDGGISLGQAAVADARLKAGRN